MTTVVKTHTGGYEFRPSECPYCKAPTLVQTPNNDNCENCGYWHCYSDGEGWVPEHYNNVEDNVSAEEAETLTNKGVA